ncbi:MAG: cytosolic protein [Candidatus Cloacimonetes bacterium 4572_65]|nr:MAG: cytosolic protein [Candidatus Cloacimonetes bacterium 4572_65]
MDCKKEENVLNCTCSYPGCDKKGICCECLAFHRKRRELPGCLFSKDAEATWDRSFEHFAKLVKNKKI